MAKTSSPKTKSARSKDADSGKLRIGDDWNALRIIALSQSNPLKAIVEFVDGDPLISRSQAKRVLVRVELFRTVVFDFSGVSSIGQAFADEIFRVFAHSHPEIQLQLIHANAAIKQMISRSRSAEARLGPLGKDVAPAGSRLRKPRR